MSSEIKLSKRHDDTPSDKPVGERGEHGNLQRPGAQFHPRARVGWGLTDQAAAWRMS